MSEEIRVKIEQFDYMFTTGFWIYRRRQGWLEILDCSQQPAIWKRYDAEEGVFLMEKPDPSFVIKADEAIPVRKALANALGEQGFVSDSHEGLRGKLTATETHLEDMRKLVFK